MRKVTVIKPEAREFYDLVDKAPYNANDDRLTDATKALLLEVHDRLAHDARNREAQPRRTLIALVLGPPWVLWVMYLMDVWGQCSP